MSVTKDSIRQLPLSSREIQQAVDIALAVVKTSYLLRVPRTPEQRANGFAAWLAQWQTKFASIVASSLRGEAPGIFAELPEDVLAEIITRQVWPDVVSFLQSYAILYQAGEWGRKHFGDATIYHEPVQEGGIWHVPIGNVGCEECLGQIVLDADGNVIESLTSTRAQLLEKLRVNQLSPVATAAGQ